MCAHLKPILSYGSEPLLTGSCNTDPTASIPTVLCITSLDGTQVPLEYTCSYDSGPDEPCMCLQVISTIYYIIMLCAAV